MEDETITLKCTHREATEKVTLVLKAPFKIFADRWCTETGIDQSTVKFQGLMLVGGPYANPEDDLEPRFAMPIDPKDTVEEIGLEPWDEIIVCDIKDKPVLITYPISQFKWIPGTGWVDVPIADSETAAAARSGGSSSGPLPPPIPAFTCTAAAASAAATISGAGDTGGSPLLPPPNPLAAGLRFRRRRRLLPPPLPPAAAAAISGTGGALKRALRSPSRGPDRPSAAKGSALAVPRPRPTRATELAAKARPALPSSHL